MKFYGFQRAVFIHTYKSWTFHASNHSDDWLQMYRNFEICNTIFLVLPYYLIMQGGYICLIACSVCYQTHWNLNIIKSVIIFENFLDLILYLADSYSPWKYHPSDINDFTVTVVNRIIKKKTHTQIQKFNKQNSLIPDTWQLVYRNKHPLSQIENNVIYGFII